MRDASFLPSFLRDMRGNTTMLFAAAAVPLVLVAGGTVDVVGQYNMKAKLQKAVDAAALAAASARDLSESQREQAARAAFQANFSHAGGAKGAIKTIKISKKRVLVRARAKAPTSFLRLIGVNNLNALAKAEVKRNYGSLDLAIVLDNTYSMKPAGKMDALKRAANKLVTMLYDGEGGEGVKIALAPFTRYVRIDKKYKNAPWLHVPTSTSVYHPKVCNTEPEYEDYNCREVTGTSFLDGVFNSYTYTKCDRRKTGRMIEVCHGDYTETHDWWGCVGSRPAPWNKRDSNYARKIPALLDINECPHEVVPLTGKSGKSDVLAVINGMSPRDSQTYIPAGLIWGWRLLSRIAPFTEGEEYSDRTHKALVLMTDGANTVIAAGERHNEGPSRPKAPEADKLTAELCANIKAKGIRIYTVAFKVSDAKTKNMLQACATEPGDYFDAASNVKLVKAFKKIGQNLASIYLAR